MWVSAECFSFFKTLDVEEYLGLLIIRVKKIKYKKNLLFMKLEILNSA